MDGNRPGSADHGVGTSIVVNHDSAHISLRRSWVQTTHSNDGSEESKHFYCTAALDLLLRHSFFDIWKHVV